MKNKIFLAAVLVMAMMIFGFQKNITEANSDDDVSFEILNVTLNDGNAEIEGVFTNNSDTDATVTAIKFWGTLKDSKGKVMYDIDFGIDLDSESCVVPANGKYPATFTLWSEEVKAYNGEFVYDITWKIEWK